MPLFPAYQQRKLEKLAREAQSKKTAAKTKEGRLSVSSERKGEPIPRITRKPSGTDIKR